MASAQRRRLGRQSQAVREIVRLAVVVLSLSDHLAVYPVAASCPASNIHPSVHAHVPAVQRQVIICEALSEPLVFSEY